MHNAQIMYYIICHGVFFKMCENMWCAITDHFFNRNERGGRARCLFVMGLRVDGRNAILSVCT